MTARAGRLRGGGSVSEDYLLWWITGTLVTELSSASATGLLDMSTRTRSTAALELSGVSAGRLPDILSTTATLPPSQCTQRPIGSVAIT